MKADKYLLLTFKRLLWIIGTWIAAVFLHNAIYALFYPFFTKNNGDEAFFFMLQRLLFHYILWYHLFIRFTGSSVNIEHFWGFYLHHQRKTYRMLCL